MGIQRPIEDQSTNLLWLGYAGLSLHYTTIRAVLIYQPQLNQRIHADYGSVPSGIHTVVVTDQGCYLPSRWRPEQIRSRWARWRASLSPEPPNER